MALAEDGFDIVLVLQALGRGMWVHPFRPNRCIKAGLAAITDGRIEITQAGRQFIARGEPAERSELTAVRTRSGRRTWQQPRATASLTLAS